MTFLRRVGGRENSGRVDLGSPDEVVVVKHSQGRQDRRTVYLGVRLGFFEFSFRVKDPESLIEEVHDAIVWTKERA